LLDIFNELYAENNFPQNWSQIIISPLYIKSDPANPGNYRPISLANTVFKLFTLMKSNRLLTWNEKNKTVSDYQGAYKRNTGCTEHVFVLNSALQYNVNNNRRVYGLFIDMSQAFDTVNHNRLWDKLNKLGVSTKLINTMREIYRIAKGRVRTSYDESGSFPIKKGVLQGETVSPILWDMYIEDLISDLDKSDTMPIKIIGTAIRALLYADDIILLVHTPGELQKKHFA
jgi:hypothetical protein